MWKNQFLFEIFFKKFLNKFLTKWKFIDTKVIKKSFQTLTKKIEINLNSSKITRRI